MIEIVRDFWREARPHPLVSLVMAGLTAGLVELVALA